MKLKGYEVRQEEIIPNEEITFENLTECGKVRLLMEAPDTFLLDAINSKSKIANGCVKNIASDCTKQTLQTAIFTLISNNDVDSAIQLLRIPHALDETFLKSISIMDSFRLKKWLLTNELSSLEVLQNIFLDACIRYLLGNKMYWEIIMQELNNPNFKVPEEELKDAITEKFSAQMYTSLKSELNSVGKTNC